MITKKLYRSWGSLKWWCSHFYVSQIQWGFDVSSKHNSVYFCQKPNLSLYNIVPQACNILFQLHACLQFYFNCPLKYVWLGHDLHEQILLISKYNLCLGLFFFTDRQGNCKIYTSSLISLIWTLYLIENLLAQRFMYNFKPIQWMFKCQCYIQ